LRHRKEAIVNGKSSSPSKIMLIRHGEKLGDPTSDDETSGKRLSIQGSARAAFLPSLFVPTPPPSLECRLTAGGSSFSGSYEGKDVPGDASLFPTPAFIFATQESKHSDRPIETITPTSVALGLTIDSKYSNSTSDIAKLANDILTKSDYAGKVILICWHHGTIDAVATALHGTGATKWVGTVFDRLWLLDYSQGSSPPIQQFGQKLLFTDEASVPAKPW
jgi:hypothetical protein